MCINNQIRKSRCRNKTVQAPKNCRIKEGNLAAPLPWALLTTRGFASHCCTEQHASIWKNHLCKSYRSVTRDIVLIFKYLVYLDG